MLKPILAIVVAIIVVMGLWTWLTLTWTYADGERAGYVQKLSKKGWICKTWEGEMAMVTRPGTVARSSPSRCRMTTSLRKSTPASASAWRSDRSVGSRTHRNK